MTNKKLRQILVASLAEGDGVWVKGKFRDYVGYGMSASLDTMQLIIRLIDGEEDVLDGIWEELAAK